MDSYSLGMECGLAPSKNSKFADVEEESESKELEMRLERLKGDSKPIKSG